MVILSDPPGETKDVQLWYMLGMTHAAAIAFSRCLDDRPVCGINSGRLARLVYVALAREQYLGDTARRRCEQMIAEQQKGKEVSLWPRD